MTFIQYANKGQINFSFITIKVNNVLIMLLGNAHPDFFDVDTNWLLFVQTDPIKFILTVIFIKSKLLSIQCFLRSKLSLVIQQVFLFILNAVTFDENSLKPLIKTVSAYGWIFKFLLQNHLPKDKNTKFRASAYSW